MAVHEYPQSHGSLAGLSDTDHHKQYGLMFPPGTAAARPGAPWREGRWYYATDTGVVSFDNGGGWVDLAGVSHAHPQDARLPRVRVPHTFTVSGEVKVASGDDFYIPPFFVPVPTGQTVQFAGSWHRINSGTSVSIALTRNGTTVYGPTPATTTPTFAAGGFSGTALAEGDLLGLVVSSPSGVPKNLTVTVYLDYIGVMA